MIYMEKTIYNVLHKCKGSISVFLVIILAPIMTMCSLIVDASRIIMAQSVIASSSDLALNTVLADFDSELAELYGLMASCQNTEKSIATAKQYFKDCLVSQGISTLQAEKYSETLSQMMNNESAVNDLLGIAVDDSTLNISAASNGSLVNTAVLKEQIIEFMKYRGPVEGLSELIEKFNSIKNTSENAEDEAKMVEEMEDYYNTENKLLEKLEEAYNNIQEYNKLGVTHEFVSNMNTYIAGVESKYKDIHIKIFKDLYNTKGINKFSYHSINTNIVSTKYSDTKKPTKRNATDLITKSAKAIRNFKNANRTLNNTVNGLAAYNGSYELQYWVQNLKTLNSNSSLTHYYNYANSVVSYRANIKNLKKYLSDDIKNEQYTLYAYDGVNTSGQKSIGEHLDALENQANGLISSNIGNRKNNYYTICNRLKGISDSQYSKTSRTETNREISDISTKLTDYYNKIDSARELSDKIKKNFDDLEDLVKQLKEDYENWHEAANKPNLNDSDLAHENKKILEEVDTETKDNVTEKSVKQIKDRFDNMTKLFDNLKKLIKSLKYGIKKKAVKDLKNVDHVINASGIKSDQIVVNESALNSNANHSFAFSKESVSTSITNTNNPQISVNTPDLYKYMDKKFTQNEGEMSKEEAKNKHQEEKDKKTEKGNPDNVDTDGSKLSTNEICNADGLPSKGSGSNKSDAGITDQIKNVSSYVSGFFGDFSNQIEQARDTYYELLYIMNMFSYDTFEYEGKYKLANKGKLGGISLDEVDQKYNSVSSKWTNEKKSFTDNKTLTNHMINSTNNYSYGNEVEYILYGGSNKENKNSAYGTIFALRYVLNMAYGFMHIYSDSSLSATADAVAVATQGIIPAPLFKIVVVLGLVTAESVYDINCLKKGMPVPIFKNDKTFKFKYLGESGGNEKLKSGELEMQYSDYLKLFLFIKLISNENAILLRTADVIQMNMRQINGYSGFRLKNSIVYFQLSAECNVSPLMLSLDLIKPQVQNVDFSKTEWNQVKITAFRGY